MITADIEKLVNAQVTDRLSLTVHSDPRRHTSAGVVVCTLDSDLMVSLDGYMQSGGLLKSILRVTVVGTGFPTDDDLPDVLGRYQILDGAIQFTPHFPFERGVSYRASVDPRPLGGPEFSEVLTLDFSLPREPTTLPAEVTHIFPSSDDLPENLLRFYVFFSNPMRRGRAEAEISLFGPNGEPAPDVAYRAPVELWDNSMQRLTILLDPGRLKRGVGPNRELGPPLKIGQAYTLAVGSGMVDITGCRLRETVHKRFRVTEAIRKPVAVEEWNILPPVTSSYQPLVLVFPRPLDWALLSQTIAIISTDEQSVEGQITIDWCEKRWSFTPTSRWAPGHYYVRISSGLEDVCGNSVIAAFDRPIRAGSELAYQTGNRSISFELA